jgi:antitoxin MazE
MPEAIIGRWGNSLVVRLPGEGTKEVDLREGARVEITAQDGCIMIRRAAPRYTIEEMFQGRSPEEWRELYAGAFDWEPDVGREIVDE